MTDLHLSRLAQWVIRQFGKALLLSMLIAALFAVLSIISGEGGFIPLAYLGGGLTFALVLFCANAPLPEREPVDENYQV